MDLRTTAEKRRDEEHQIIRDKYLEIFRGVGATFKPWRICVAVSQYTKEAGLRAGYGYTAQSVYNIINH